MSHVAGDTPRDPPLWKQRLSNILVLAGLGAIGAWGHQTHWKPGFASANTLEPPKKSAPSTLSPISLVKFASEASISKTGIVTTKPIRRDLSHFVSANGVVQYDQARLAQLSARAPGAVWRVEKSVGQLVRKGDVLAIIESVEVGNAKADFLTAIANVDVKQRLLEILGPLSDVVAQRNVKEAEGALREARTKLYNAHQSLVNLGLPISVAEAQRLNEAELAARIQFLGVPPSIARGLDPQTTTGNLMPLVAPFDGVVLGREVAIGEVVHPSQSQFVVVDMSEMWVTLDFRSEDGQRVRLGQPFEFRPDGSSQAVRSTVSWISTEVDEKTRTIQVRADVANEVLEESSRTSNGLAPRRLLRANVFGAGRVEIERKTGALLLPRKAVQFDRDQPVVFVQRDGLTFVMLNVTVGIQEDEQIEIVAGIGESDNIVTIGSHLLKAEIQKQRSMASH